LSFNRATVLSLLNILCYGIGHIGQHQRNVALQVYAERFFLLLLFYNKQIADSLGIEQQTIQA
jgi:hypothetical protein